MSREQSSPTPVCRGAREGREALQPGVFLFVPHFGKQRNGLDSTLIWNLFIKRPFPTQMPAGSRWRHSDKTWGQRTPVRSQAWSHPRPAKNQEPDSVQRGAVRAAPPWAPSCQHPLHL